MKAGQIRLGLAFTGSYIRAEHDTTFEPEPGVAPGDLARRHRLRIGAMSWAATAQFGFHQRLAAELALPFNANVVRADFLDADDQPIEGYRSIHHRDETVSGVGDFVLAARVGVLRPSEVPRLSLDLRLGAALPTGRTEPNPFALAARGLENQRMFFGSGTVDPVLGLQGRTRFETWSLVFWTNARLRLYTNDRGYNAGHLLGGGVEAISGFGLDRWSFGLSPEVQHQTPATWAAIDSSGDSADGVQTALNSGRTTLLLGVGAYYAPEPTWQLFVQAKAPFVLQAQAGDLAWPFLGTVGVRYAFGVGGGEHRHAPHGDDHDRGEHEEHEH